MHFEHWPVEANPSEFHSGQSRQIERLDFCNSELARANPEFAHFEVSDFK